MESIFLFMERRYKRFLYLALITLLLFILSMIIDKEVFTGSCLIVSGVFEAYKSYYLSTKENGDFYYFWYNEVIKGYILSLLFIFSGLIPILG